MKVGFDMNMTANCISAARYLPQYCMSHSVSFCGGLGYRLRARLSWNKDELAKLPLANPTSGSFYGKHAKRSLGK